MFVWVMVKEVIPICSIVLYLNTNIPYKKGEILKSVKEISELPEDSGGIYKSGFFRTLLARPIQLLPLLILLLSPPSSRESLRDMLYSPNVVRIYVSVKRISKSSYHPLQCHKFAYISTFCKYCTILMKIGYLCMT